MSTNKKLAIIIVNWNQFNLTHDCIISLKNCDYGNFKIILVDNASEDKSGIKLINKFPDVVFIQNKKNLGFTGANNIGIKYAINHSFKFVMLLNNDTEVDKNFISPLINKLSNNSNVGAVQPVITNWHNRNRIWNFGGKINKFTGQVQTINKGKKIDQINLKDETEWISGCCFVIKSEIIEKVGKLDNSYFVYFEDVDWSVRIVQAGYKLELEPKSLIYHHEGASWKNKKKSREGSISPYTHYLNIRNHIYFILKFKHKFNPIGVLLYQIIKIGGYSLYFLMRFRFLKLKMVWKGLMDAFKIKVS
jgi:GT2 family glycosyltransferase